MPEPTPESVETPETPLWLQGRAAVIAAADPAHWRAEMPDYHLSHEVMPDQRTFTFDPEQVEHVVEQIVQTFEMEVSHKPDPATWVSMVERFQTRVNGGTWHSSAEIAETGSYNILIGKSEYYRTEDETFESSHDIFHTALPGGFFWEVLEVLSPPPTVAFKWRHWGDFTGTYKPAGETEGFHGDGKRIEMFGMSVAKVDDNLKLVEVEHFYDPNAFLASFTDGCPVAHAN